MLFSSSVFLFLFLPVVLLVYYLPCGGGGRGRTCFCCWPPWLLCLGDAWFVLVMLGSIWPITASAVGGCLQAGGTDLRAPSCDRPGGESWYPVCI